MKRTYLYIDTENIGIDSWLPFLRNLSVNDAVKVFIAQNSKLTVALNSSLFEVLRNTVCKVEFVKCSVGTSNAMDFNIVSELAITASTAKKSRHIIVSRDSGFRAAIDRLVLNDIDARQVYSCCRLKHDIRNLWCVDCNKVNSCFVPKITLDGVVEWVEMSDCDGFNSCKEICEEDTDI